MDPLAQYAGHRFIGVAVGRNVLGNETLNSIACSGAAVEERRHIRRDHMPGEMTYIDLDQFGRAVQGELCHLITTYPLNYS